MKRLIRLLQWVLKAAVFFTLFAFALNNQQETRVNFFFSTHWSAPTVLVVLLAFTLGLVLGVLVMVPRWWRERRINAPNKTPSNAAPTTTEASSGN